MTVASIDIGSNTILLLICKIDLTTRQIKTIKNYYRTPRISKGLKEGEQISDIKIRQLLEVLVEYRAICTKYSVEKTLIAATNALRIASNSEIIINRVKNETGFEISVIDGDTEAQLSFWGAVFNLENNDSKAVIDIGGGSTEIIFGDMNKIFFKKSFQIGVVSLTENMFIDNDFSPEKIINAEEYVASIFNSIQNIIPTGTESIAVAGTPTTLSCIKQNLRTYDEDLVDGSEITFYELCNMIDEISKLSQIQIKNNYGQVVEGREDVLLAGSIILKIFMEKLKLSKIKVSNKGLRYGVVIDYINNNQ